jgi:HSP20 family protein
MIIRWQPFSQADSLRRQIDEVFNELADSAEARESWWYPPVEVIDTPDSLQIHAQLPGVNHHNLDIQATRDAVMITGDRPYPKQDEHQTWLRSEFAYGKFRRLINLPVEINPDQIQASFNNGLLTLMLPKAEHARRRVVKINGEQISTEQFNADRLSSAPEQRALNVASEEVVNGVS